MIPGRHEFGTNNVHFRPSPRRPARLVADAAGAQRLGNLHSAL